MKIKLKATKVKLTPMITEYIQEKMDMLERNLGSIKVMNCDVEVGMITTRHNKGDVFKAEVNLELPKELIRVEKSEKDLYKAIDKVKDHLTRSIAKYKEKRIAKKRKTEEITVEQIME